MTPKSHSVDGNEVVMAMPLVRKIDNSKVLSTINIHRILIDANHWKMQI